VDDAIVVVENVERVMEEEGLPPKEATRKSMGQITGALIGIALVLSAVFVPMAFFSGSTGAIYRQFSLTVVSAMTLSVIVALILTPALCATILKAPKAQPGHAGKAHGHQPRRGFFGWVNRTFDRGNVRYQRGVGHMIRKPGRYLVIYLLIVVGLGVLFMRLSSAFLPNEDQGILISQVSLPAGSSMERTLEAVKAMEHHYLVDEKDNVNGLFTVTGFSFSGRGQNTAIGFANLKDWSIRGSGQGSVFAIAQRAMMSLSKVRDAMIFAFTPPAIIELGIANGFDMQLVDRGGLGHEKLMQARGQLLGLAARNPKLAAVRPNGLDDNPQLRIDIDREKASALGLSLADINTTLQATWGSSYVNDFIESGRVKRVYIQADAQYRMLPSDLDRWYMRNANGEMVPFSTFSTTHWDYGSPRLERFNGVSSINIQGQPAPGVSTGEAMAAMEELARQLPSGISFEWQGLSYEERLSGSQAPALYAISVLVVFLCLAALYESWSIPAAVILVVPLGILGAVIAALLRGLPNDVYFQVGLLTTIGLSAKNAILIVEFAKDLHEQGMSLIDATIQACRQRLRPILMTSLAFILGVLPLAISTGAGSGSQNAIGVGVMGGMISATILAIFFVPVFFVSVLGLVARWAPGKDDHRHAEPAQAD